MLEYFIYKQTPAGQVCNGSQGNLHSELLGVSSFSLGVFEVKAKGGQPMVGDRILLPVKGSKQLSMMLQVESAEPLITPLGGWSAKCEGPAQAEFNVKFANINCDNCHQAYELEFIDYSGDTQSDAIAGMNKQGWQANSDKQICPECKAGHKTVTERMKDV